MAYLWGTQLGATPAQITELTTHMDMWGRTHTNDSVLVYAKTMVRDTDNPTQFKEGCTCSLLGKLS